MQTYIGGAIEQPRLEINKGSPQEKILKYVHWLGDSMILGHLADYPDYWTQGETMEELEENLRILYEDIVSGVPSKNSA